MDEFPEGSGSDIMQEIPDPNSLEVATYGSEYQRVKAMIYILDMMEEMAVRDYDMAVAAIHGDRYKAVRYILTHRPFVLKQDRPHVESYEEIQTIRIAKDLMRKRMAVDWIRTRRAEVDAYGTITGTQEYGQLLQGMGISPDLYRRAMRQKASAGITNDYASIRKIRTGADPFDMESDEERRIREMNEAILLANEYDRSLREYPEDGPTTNKLPDGRNDERGWLDIMEDEIAEQEQEQESDDEGEVEEPDVSLIDPALLLIVPEYTVTEPPVHEPEPEIPAEPTELPEEWAGILPGGSGAAEVAALAPFPVRDATGDDDGTVLRLPPEDSEEYEVLKKRHMGVEIERIAPACSTADDAIDAVRKAVDGIDTEKGIEMPVEDEIPWYEKEGHGYEDDDGTVIFIGGDE